MRMQSHVMSPGVLRDWTSGVFFEVTVSGTGVVESIERLNNGSNAVTATASANQHLPLIGSVYSVLRCSPKCSTGLINLHSHLSPFRKVNLLSPFYKEYKC